MAKAVRGFFRPIGKVLTAGLKQVAKVVTKVVPGGDKLVKHVRGFHHKYGKKILKAVAVAAAIYFTGGAAMGAISGAAAGTGAWAGAMSGLSASWAGVAGAGSALVGTGTAASGMATGLTGAANALGAGWAGAAGAGAAAGLSGAAATAAAGQAGLGFGAAMSTTAANLGTVTGLGGSGSGANPVWVTDPATGLQTLSTEAARTGATTAAKEGILMTAAKNPLVQQAVVQGAGKAIQGGMQAKAANDADEQRRLEEEDARGRYNTNVGTRLSAFDTYIPPAGQPQQFQNNSIFERARY